MSSKLKDRLMARTANLADKVAEGATERTPIAEQRPMTMPGQLGAFRLEAQRYQRKIEELTAELEAARNTGGAVELPVDKLHEVPGRRRFKPREKYVELLENVRHNGLIEPVVVLTRPDGEWDIWSGHHRVDTHRDLSLPTIRCVLGTAKDEVEATDGAFFANLMQSDLTDYEKFIGLKRFHEGHPEFTQSDVAERSGLSKQAVSDLFAFGRLPSEVLDIVDANKTILGAGVAADLASLAEAGKAARVIEAVQQLADKKLDQKQALKFARTVEAPAKPAAAAEKFKVKAGKATWCDVRRVGNVMRIEFKSEEQASAAQEAIRLHLERMAQESSHHLE
ncbi:MULTISPECIES: ParB/RepB/Spo0J family partition protein [unclassified Paraburkholderia]|uniref:ParB/RepB/Spo0J family partition protein n=1 Tax=unclassified Paraburkholderia TaxID=2615204 RepID=UPI002AB71153|nr:MULTISPECIES: ParB N-terminal domain-containing protein [unclassified Paraburkholderia]